MTLARYAAFVLCLALFGASAAGALSWPWAWPPRVLFGALTLLGVRDLLQRRHSLQRNFPVISHIGWIAEFVRPQIRGLWAADGRGATIEVRFAEREDAEQTGRHFSYLMT
jgi:hypothetical protein